MIMDSKHCIVYQSWKRMYALLYIHFIHITYVHISSTEELFDCSIYIKPPDQQ
jgi:hypothetical protein